MSLRSSQSEVERFNAVARAWFPKPEFIMQSQLSINNHMLRVRHMASGMCFDTVVESLMMQSSDDVEEIIQKVIEPLAWKAHTELGLLGYGAPYEIGENYDMETQPRTLHDDHEAKRALLNLMGIQLLERDAQGIGKLIFMVRHGKWARRVSTEMLDKPIEWWQMFISHIIKNGGQS